ncbi:MAG: hypothetical protein AAB152_17320 [Candidatus Coatesbacteria bacterium]
MTGPAPVLPPPPRRGWPLGITVFCVLVMLVALWLRLNHRAG